MIIDPAAVIVIHPGPPPRLGFPTFTYIAGTLQAVRNHLKKRKARSGSGHRPSEPTTHPPTPACASQSRLHEALTRGSHPPRLTLRGRCAAQMAPPFKQAAAPRFPSLVAKGRPSFSMPLPTVTLHAYACLLSNSKRKYPQPPPPWFGWLLDGGWWCCGSRNDCQFTSRAIRDKNKNKRKNISTPFLCPSIWWVGT